MGISHNCYRNLLICIFLIVVTTVVYIPVRNYDFVRYDDDDFITENPHVRSGLSRPNIRWALTAIHTSYWHPLTWLSHILDCELFDLKAGYHHLTNLFFHLINSILLFFVLYRGAKAVWPSAFVAAIFALHPLHVESVAWIAERKDVLSTCFWLLTVLTYINYARRPKTTTYLLTLLFFVLGLMSKPMLVNLPAVLVLLDYWPLERLSLEKNRLWSLVFEKIPFFALSAVLSVITFLAQRSVGAMTDIETFDFKIRFANAIVSYVTYIQKMFWPTRLAVFYPHPGQNIAAAHVILSVLVLLLLTVVFIYLGRRFKYLAFGWLLFLGILVPVIGLVQVGAQARADRYTYISLTGLFIIIAWTAAQVTERLRNRRILLGIGACAILVALSVVTHFQLRHWKDSASLFGHTINVTKNNWLMHNNYASFLKSRGRADLAIEHFNIALKIKPDSPEAHNNLGNALVDIGRIQDGIGHYRRAIELRPGFAAAHYNLASVFAKAGQSDLAISGYLKAVELDQQNIDALSNLGFEYAKKGRYDLAIEYYDKALAVDWQHIITLGRKGLALASLNRLDEAIEHFRIVLRARPEDVEMYCNLGILLERQGKIGEATAQYQHALQIKPDYTKAAELLEAALALQKKQ